MASGERWKSYKTKGNVEEGRRRREEEGVQLRKLRREEQVSIVMKYLLLKISIFMYSQIAKRRNIDDVDQSDDSTSNHEINNGSKVKIY